MEIFSAKVDLEGVRDLVKRYPEESQAAQVAKITEALLLLESTIKPMVPVGAGPIHLRDTIFQKTMVEGESVWGMIGTPAEYGLPVEMGTRPHFPPVAPIQFWVEKGMGLTGKEAKSVAFLIARAISRRGTPARQPFESGYEEVASTVDRILKQIPEDIVRRLES